MEPYLVRDWLLYQSKLQAPRKGAERSSKVQGIRTIPVELSSGLYKISKGNSVKRQEQRTRAERQTGTCFLKDWPSP